MLSTELMGLDEPVIQFVDQLIANAIDKKVSDIHIEPEEDKTRVRFRIDGILHEKIILPGLFYCISKLLISSVFTCGSL